MKKYFHYMPLLMMQLALCKPAFAQDTTQGKSLAEHLFKKEMPAAVNVNLHLRAGINYNSINKDTEISEAGFKFDHVMLDINGNITDKLSYKYLQRMNKSFTNSTVENLSNSIDYAYVRYQFHPKAAVLAGRQALFLGGFEYNEYPVDVYDYNGITNNITCYLTGISLYFYPWENQEFGIQAVNNRTASSSDAYGTLPEGMKKSSLPLYYAMAWNGSFLDQRLGFRYAVAAGEQMKGKWVLMLGAGQRFSTGKFSIYLDALYHRAAIDHLGVIRKMTLDTEGNLWNGIAQHTDYFSVAAETCFRFHSKWNIRVKGFYDRAGVFKDNQVFVSGNYLSAWRCQGGIEYFPMKDNNLHLFLNATGNFQKEKPTLPVIQQKDNFRISLGAIYRLPVL